MPEPRGWSLRTRLLVLLVCLAAALFGTSAVLNWRAHHEASDRLFDDSLRVFLGCDRFSGVSEDALTLPLQVFDRLLGRLDSFADQSEPRLSGSRLGGRCVARCAESGHRSCRRNGGRRRHRS